MSIGGNPWSFGGREKDQFYLRNNTMCTTDKVMFERRKALIVGEKLKLLDLVEIMKTTIAIISLACSLAFCGDAEIAEAMAKSGAQLSAKGKYDQAEAILYKALANDEKCGLALLELAKIAEKSGDNRTAVSFYQRASSSLKPGPKKTFCDKRPSHKHRKSPERFGCGVARLVRSHQRHQRTAQREKRSRCLAQ